jgi:hypothetical protein
MSFQQTAVLQEDEMKTVLKNKSVFVTGSAFPRNTSAS